MDRSCSGFVPSSECDREIFDRCERVFWSTLEAGNKRAAVAATAAAADTALLIVVFVIIIHGKIVHWVVRRRRIKIASFTQKTVSSFGFLLILFVMLPIAVVMMVIAVFGRWQDHHTIIKGRIQKKKYSTDCDAMPRVHWCLWWQQHLQGQRSVVSRVSVLLTSGLGSCCRHRGKGNARQSFFLFTVQVFSTVTKMWTVLSRNIDCCRPIQQWVAH